MGWHVVVPPLYGLLEARERARDACERARQTVLEVRADRARRTRERVGSPASPSRVDPERAVHFFELRARELRLAGWNEAADGAEHLAREYRARMAVRESSLPRVS